MSTCSKNEKCNCAELCPFSFGLACGILWAICAFTMGMVVMMTAKEYGTAFVSSVGTLYIGYKATFLGSIIGAIWAFFDAFILGLVLIWLYNALKRCCCKK
jgi:hypothetical protein